MDNINAEILYRRLKDDLELINNKGGRIQKILKQLIFSDKEKHIEASFKAEFRSIKSAHKEYIDLGEALSVIHSVPEQVKLLVPQIIELETKMNNLRNRINGYLEEKKLELRQGRLVTIERDLEQIEPQLSGSKQIEPQLSGSKQIEPQLSGSKQIEPQLSGSKLIIPKDQITSYSSPIFQITMPLRLHSIKKLQSEKFSLISNFIVNTNLELQLKCLKTQNNKNKIFFGINININPKLSNLAKCEYKKSTFVNVRSFDTTASISRCTINNDTYLTFDLGRILKFKNNEFNISTNIGHKNKAFKKENLNFQIESKLDLPFLPTIVSKQGLYYKSEFIFCYDFFPFANSIVKNIQMNKEEKTLVLPTVTQSSNLSSNFQTQSLVEKESGLIVETEHAIKNSNLSCPEQHIVVSASPQSLTVQPNFSQKYGAPLLALISIIGILVGGYIVTKKKNHKPFN